MYESEQDHYQVLGLDANASLVDIKRAFFKLAKTCHPDRGGSNDQFRQIRTAYEHLNQERMTFQFTVHVEKAWSGSGSGSGSDDEMQSPMGYRDGQDSDAERIRKAQAVHEARMRQRSGVSRGAHVSSDRAHRKQEAAAKEYLIAEIERTIQAAVEIETSFELELEKLRREIRKLKSQKRKRREEERHREEENEAWKREVGEWRRRLAQRRGVKGDS